MRCWLHVAYVVLPPTGSMSTGSCQVMYPAQSLHWDIPEQSLCLQKLGFDSNLSSSGSFLLVKARWSCGNVDGILPALWLGAASLQPQFTLCLLTLFFSSPQPQRSHLDPKVLVLLFVCRGHSPNTSILGKAEIPLPVSTSSLLHPACGTSEILALQLAHHLTAAFPLLREV